MCLQSYNKLYWGFTILSILILYIHSILYVYIYLLCVPIYHLPPLPSHHTSLWFFFNSQCINKIYVLFSIELSYIVKIMALLILYTIYGWNVFCTCYNIAAFVVTTYRYTYVYIYIHETKSALYYKLHMVNIEKLLLT